MNKWYQLKRYEFAVQWQNVGSGAPQWRYWILQTRARQVGVYQFRGSYCLEGGRWHTFNLEGKIVDGQRHYQSFTIDKITYNLDLTVHLLTLQEKLIACRCCQLDGNKAASPYDLFIDQVSFFATVNC